MSRTIDADALINRIVFHTDFKTDVKELFEDEINAEPTIEPERKKGWWIEHNPHKWGLGIVFECSECGEKIDCEPSNFCPNCGADMREGGESDEPKRCDTCKHEKSRWFSRCADCSDYESWEGKDETGRSTTEN